MLSCCCFPFAECAVLMRNFNQKFFSNGCNDNYLLKALILRSQYILRAGYWLLVQVDGKYYKKTFIQKNDQILYRNIHSIDCFEYHSQSILTILFQSKP